MTDYFVVPDTCRGIAGRAQEGMLARNDHFSKVLGALEDAFNACGSGRSVKGGSGVLGYFERFPDLPQELYQDKLKPTHQGICSHIDHVIGAFSDAVDSYVSGDIEQKVRAESEANGDVALDYPTVMNSDGTVLREGGTAGTGNNDNSAHKRAPVDTSESPATSPFSTHPDYEDNTP
ncbi:hypothetical protein [Citricoccus nitrophenolicus]|uniref:hypothetical protein n=1 Tax=Citricoccus nitrophenolicus TaxID=863575 RepID=UPI0039B4B864